ncbi:hypothetical protein CDIK_0805 [Cucumispora dikerogammari]|nr:hypothetical protein CDIK_0805 [Cucumispora dikerogammari]
MPVSYYRLLYYLKADFLSAHLYCQNIKTAAEQNLYVDLQDLIKDADLEEKDDQQWAQLYHNGNFEMKKEMRILPLDFPEVKYSYVKLPQAAFILLPLFIIEPYEVTSGLKQFFAANQVLNKIYRISDEGGSDESEEAMFSFGTDISDGVVKSVKYDNEEIFSNTEDGDRLNRSAFFVFVDKYTRELTLYAGALIKNSGGERSEKFSTFLNVHFLGKKNDLHAGNASFEISVDISALIVGFSVYGSNPYEDDSIYKDVELILPLPPGVKHGDGNHRLTVNLIREENEGKIQYRIIKSFGQGSPAEGRVRCYGDVLRKFQAMVERNNPHRRTFIDIR